MVVVKELTMTATSSVESMASSSMTGPPVTMRLNVTWLPGLIAAQGTGTASGHHGPAVRERSRWAATYRVRATTCC